MKSISPKKSHKKILLVGLIITGLLLASVAYLFVSKIGPFAYRADNSINLDEPTEEEKNAGSETKKRSTDPNQEDKTQTGSDPAPQPQPIEGSDKQSVNIEITATNQDESYLRVRSLIQTVTNEGACNLTMTGPQNQTYKASVAVQSLPSSSTCKGFDVPLDQLTPGTWIIELGFSNSTLIASTSKEVVIE